jgi:hypothetical protein
MVAQNEKVEAIREPCRRDSLQESRVALFFGGRAGEQEERCL